jgi:hypothetical protein
MAFPAIAFAATVAIRTPFNYDLWSAALLCDQQTVPAEVHTMFLPDHPEQEVNASPAPVFSPSKFFHDAYEQGVVKAVEENPREAGVVATLAAGAAVICLTQGRALVGLFRNGVGEAVGLGRWADSVVAKELPITLGKLGEAEDAGLVVRPQAAASITRHLPSSNVAAQDDPTKGLVLPAWVHSPDGDIEFTHALRPTASNVVADAENLKMLVGPRERALLSIADHEPLLEPQGADGEIAWDEPWRVRPFLHVMEN